MERPHLAAVKGIAAMLASGLLLVVNDALIKSMAANYPIGEILFLRGLAAAPVIALFAWRAGGIAALRIRDVRGQLARAALNIVGGFFFVAALARMPLAEVIAITFTAPIFVAFLAGPLLGERMDRGQWIALAVGTIGMLVVLVPHGWGMLGIVALLPLMNAITQALKFILTRRISLFDSSTATLFFSTAMTTSVALLTLPMGWSMPDGSDLGLFLLAGIAMGFGHYLAIEAYRLAQAVVVTPFVCGEVLWSVIIGFVVWREVPSAGVYFGSAIIVAASIYLVWRQTPGIRRRSQV